jgi:hypothetical protein
MKKVLVVCCFFLITVKVFGQQFSQYNTGTLYDSFENPSQRAFIPDTSRMFAFNFFIPNFSADLFVTGNAQAALKSRIFSNYYNTADLQIGKGNYNHGDFSANAYSIMFKVFTSLNGDQEIGFFTNTKAEGRGVVSDESLAIFNGGSVFPGNGYNNIFNDNYYYQAYHQIGFTYREQVTKKLAIGIKLSALSGISYKKIVINQSHIAFDKANDQATVYLQGTNYTDGLPDGDSNSAKVLPTFLNPGAAISLGASYRDADGFKWQWNVKDLGFIHWNRASTVNHFSGDTLITGLSTPQREKNITTALSHITSFGESGSGFTTNTNGLLEVSVNKDYWLDYDQQFRFSPTLIASKELFYAGFTAALVAPVQYQNYTISLTSSYNDLKLLTFGGQFMVKSTSAEFFIGSEKLYQSASLFRTALRGNTGNQNQFTTSPGSYSGADIFLGVSFKFGPTIEHPMNSSTIPNGDKGFLGRLYDKWFKKDKNY